MHDSILDPTSGVEAAAEIFVGPRLARSRPRVAVVDDSREFLGLIRDVLGERYDVAPYAVLRSIDDIARADPDMLILDLHSGGPEGGLTGWEILALARSHPTLRYVPVVVCSADLDALRQDRIRLVAYGNVQLVAKPFEITAFEQTVDRILRLAATQRPTVLEDGDYPPLHDRVDEFREGRPLEMCPHGRVRSQGERCSRCG